MQIAVTVANPLLLNSFTKQIFIHDVKLIGEMANRFERCS